ncbi:MAG: preprotein translocase subunit Sec61beta [Candidatus Aenigmarchaeota archaeon]|nr:preprotein translocase subunit Sec61beta [Candidatus Aenigmarchaeota archaeon]MCX8191134.1 preprotein translocase subunit Sec61beta [Candidatus Aenigmarchaeota archaeon]MDW8160355.1 preprotein translocase subunit Sec61beta [Candidatus Aenigmarchaeota archaeon]
MTKQKDKVYLPVGMGGLIRYGEQEETKLTIKPEHLIYLSVGLGILLVVLRFLLL